MGDTFALRLSLDKVPVVRLRLYISVIADASSSAQVFIILSGNPSGPLALLVFKLKKKDNIGVAPIKDKGQLYSDSQTKAELLSKQFKSVFTQENSSRMGIYYSALDLVLYPCS
jgi:hypothetical protein